MSAFHLIALHGAGMNAQVWGGLAPHLAAAGYGAAFQALTLPGHHPGDAEEALLHSVPEMAVWLQEQISAVPAGREVMLIGHSMGAAVAFHAAGHPRVGGVIALCSAASMPVNAELLALAKADPAAAQALIVKWGCNSLHPQAAAVRQVVGHILQAAPLAAIGADLAACAQMLPVPLCAKKTLVISGRFDKMTPVEQGAALAERQGARHVVVDAGHMLPCEHAPEVARIILSFLDAL